MRDTARRGGRFLPPTAEPAIGDVLVIAGMPHVLVEIKSAGRNSQTRFYHFKDPLGCDAWVSANSLVKKERRT